MNYQEDMTITHADFNARPIHELIQQLRYFNHHDLCYSVFSVCSYRDVTVEPMFSADFQQL